MDILWTVVALPRRLRERRIVAKMAPSYERETRLSFSVSDPLAELCDRHGSDKGSVDPVNRPYPWLPHTYTSVYRRLFEHRRTTVHHVLEIGIGSTNPAIVSNMGPNGRPGASLRVWRDYFPNAQITGVDIDHNVMFQEERIRTAVVDQTDPASIRTMLQSLGPTTFDVIIDDGLHIATAALTSFDALWPTMNTGGVYVIEDLSLTDARTVGLHLRELGVNHEIVIQPTGPGSLILQNTLVIAHA